MKTCKKCGEEKLLADFYLLVGEKRHSYCKECLKRYARTHPAKLETRRRLGKKHARKTRLEKWGKVYAQSKSWKKENPEKNNAHQAVARAIRKGKLSKKPCEVCGGKRVHAHHENYSQPLTVSWLCSIHHRARHDAIIRKMSGI